jgi:hypothetical protein
MNILSIPHDDVFFYTGPCSLIEVLDLITPRDAEKLYGVGRATLTQLRNASAFPPAFDVHGCIMYRRQDIALLGSQTRH